jgi:hypothetical protein
MLEELVPCGALLPLVLLASVLLLVLLALPDWAAAWDRAERQARRERILRNTKSEAIRQAREPILATRRPGDVETEGLGRVLRSLETCVVRARL